MDEPVVQIQKGERYREGKVEKARSELNPVTSTSNFEISKIKEPKKEQETRSTKKNGYRSRLQGAKASSRLQGKPRKATISRKRKRIQANLS